MKKIACLLLISLVSFAQNVSAQNPSIRKLLFGVAYYDEYMPYERLDKDIEMMKEAELKFPVSNLFCRIKVGVFHTRRNIFAFFFNIHFYIEVLCIGCKN